MEPIIKHRSQMLLAGCSFFGDPFHSHAGWTDANEIGRLWKRLMRFWATPEIQNSPFGPHQPKTYEIHLQNQVTPETGEYEVFIGFEIQALETVPLELVLKVLPEAEYAIFTVSGEMAHSDEPYIDHWLSRTGHKMAYPFIGQCYDKRFKGLDQLGESELDVFAPIVRVK
jgi:AraC family transcriptional regulator